jgi:hypothetical protein
MCVWVCVSARAHTHGVSSQNAEIPFPVLTTQWKMNPVNIFIPLFIKCMGLCVIFVHDNVQQFRVFPHCAIQDAPGQITTNLLLQVEPSLRILLFWDMMPHH